MAGPCSAGIADIAGPATRAVGANRNRRLGAAELAKLTQPGNSQFGHDRAAVSSLLADVGPGLKTAGSVLLQ